VILRLFALTAHHLRVGDVLRRGQRKWTQRGSGGRMMHHRCLREDEGAWSACDDGARRSEGSDGSRSCPE
jgi:hypothetical protein